jgi:hypothetical protein
LPTVWAFLNIRIIAFGVVAVIPVTGWILLGGRWRLLDVDWRCYRYCDHSRWKIIGVLIRISIVRIRIKRCNEVKTKTGMTVVASIAPATAMMSTTITSTMPSAALAGSFKKLFRRCAVRQTSLFFCFI